MSSKNSKRSQAQETRNTAALDKASNLELDKALSSVSSASINAQGLFGDISKMLVTKYAELQAVNDSIGLKRSELEELHGRDRLLLSLDDLRMEYDKEKLQQQEERAQLIKAREQQSDEYDYELNQKRKAANDQWDEMQRVRDRNNLIKQEEFDKNLKERENELKRIDLEYKAAIDKANSFDDVLKKEVEKQVSIVTNVLKKDHAHITQISDIQYKAEVEKLSLDNSRLTATINHNDTIIVSLQKQLAAAQDAQTRLASEAVSAAANQKGMADMQSLITNIGGPNGARNKA